MVILFNKVSTNGKFFLPNVRHSMEIPNEIDETEFHIYKRYAVVTGVVEWETNIYQFRFDLKWINHCRYILYCVVQWANDSRVHCKLIVFLSSFFLRLSTSSVLLLLLLLLLLNDSHTDFKFQIGFDASHYLICLKAAAKKKLLRTPVSLCFSVDLDSLVVQTIAKLYISFNSCFSH